MLDHKQKALNPHLLNKGISSLLTLYNQLVMLQKVEIYYWNKKDERSTMFTEIDLPVPLEDIMSITPDIRHLTKKEQKKLNDATYIQKFNQVNS